MVKSIYINHLRFLHAIALGMSVHVAWSSIGCLGRYISTGVGLAGAFEQKLTVSKPHKVHCTSG
jgi:hypothetical protein